MNHKRMYSVIVQNAKEILNITKAGKLYVVIVQDGQGNIEWIKFDESVDDICCLNLLTGEAVRLRGRAARKKFALYIRHINQSIRANLRKKRKAEKERKARLKGVHL